MVSAYATPTMNPYQTQQHFGTPYQPFNPSGQTQQIQNPYLFAGPYQTQQGQYPYQPWMQDGLGSGQGLTQELANIITPIVRSVLPLAMGQPQAPWQTGGQQFGFQGTPPWAFGGSSSLRTQISPQQIVPQVVSSVMQAVLPAVLSFCQPQQGQHDGARLGTPVQYPGLQAQVLPQVVASVIQGVLPAVLSLYQTQPGLAAGVRAPIFG